MQQSKMLEIFNATVRSKLVIMKLWRGKFDFGWLPESR